MVPIACLSSGAVQNLVDELWGLPGQDGLADGSAVERAPVADAEVDPSSWLPSTRWDHHPSRGPSKIDTAAFSPLAGA